MDLSRTLALMLDPSLLLRARGLRADPWQRDLLLSGARQILLNCSRQSGKSTVVAALALLLTYQEAPAYVWLWGNLLAALAVARAAPEGRFRTLARYWLMLLGLYVLVIGTGRVDVAP